MSKPEIFQNRIKILVQILNIPLEEKWEEWTGKDTYSLYKYWHSLQLISDQELTHINEGKGSLTPSPLVQKFFKNLNIHFAPRYYQGGEVADVGSGFGFITLWLVLNGAKHVHSIGDPHRIQFIQRLYERAVTKNLIAADKVSCYPEFVKVGDTRLGKGMKKNSLSLVLLNDTLEHITPRIFPWLVKSTFNNLKEGGFFISRQLNTDSPLMLKRLGPVWELEEEKYRKQRKKLIEESLPTITKEEANILAKHTRGMDSVDFFAALDQYNTDQTIPPYNPNLPPIDVVIDVPYEGDTNIKRITSEFRKNKFKRIRVYPDLLASRRSRYLQGFAKLEPGIFLKGHLFDLTTVFRIQK